MEARKTERKGHRRHDEAFRREAVRLLAQPGAQLKVIAAEIGVSAVSLRSWRDRMLGQNDAPAGWKPEDMAEENRRLKEELLRVREERDILKKACGILSTPSRSGMPK